MAGGRGLASNPWPLVSGVFPIKRIRVEIEGIVQGVGFRPFVYRLASSHRLTGWVKNTPAGVLLEAEGVEDDLAHFLRGIAREAPSLAVISSVKNFEVLPRCEDGFDILASGGGEISVQISPDCNVCPDCLRELFDPLDRRYRYPFINCTNCGPRYSIITGIPYDRPFTTMAGFGMCDACRSEYEDPADRRFHAQPTACSVCGPRFKLLDGKGREVAGEPLEEAVQFLKGGKVLAIKGIGGYHLTVDACNDAAVRVLRQRKMRDEKPFALMAPNLAEISGFALADETEERLLAGTECPIVLLRKREGNPISPLVAPTNGYFGVMLPSAPHHHLLLRDNFRALLMTSGNLTDEPIVFRENEALAKLGEIADFFLTHDREIHTRTDDSVIRVFQGNPLFLRRSRGYVPRSIVLPSRQRSILAVGAELKATVCLIRGDRAFMSQHVGDLKNTATIRSLEETVEHMERILLIKPEMVAHDMHPDYLSTHYAEGLSGLPKFAVQHHHAHMASCMAENGLEGEVIGVVFDGTGYGLDGKVWGGEFLLGGYRNFRRVGHFRYTPMPGGDAAVREPYRMAIAYLFPLFGEFLFDLPLPCMDELQENDRKLFLKMLEGGINSPLTSSCGRFFDAVAAMLGVRSRVSYEGQAAILLEALAEESCETGIYPFSIEEDEGYELDFSLMVRAIVEDMLAGRPRREIARTFHNTISAASAWMCEEIRAKTGIGRVVLSGGVFQNRLLSEALFNHLKADGFAIFNHRLVPTNDGGIALGQAVIAGETV